MRRVALILLAGLAACGGEEPSPYAELGRWSLPVDIPVVAGHFVLMPTGKVLAWQHMDADPMSTQSYYFDPDAPLTGKTDETPYEIFCSGMTILPDRRLVVTGSNRGRPLTALFDPDRELWTMGPTMAGVGRFYPSTIILGDGRLISFGGLEMQPELNEEGEAVALRHDLTIEEAPADASEWTLVGGEDMPEQGEEAYGRVHLLPDGKIFMSSQSPRSYIYDPAERSWTQVATTSLGKWRAESPSVRLFDGRIMLSGGHDRDMEAEGSQQVTETAEVIDPMAANPTWQPVAPMSGPRTFHDSLLLPDGRVFNVGGAADTESEQEIFEPEIYDPASDTWTKVAPHEELRGYHSSATLLPDGRVLVGGTDSEPTIEIYSPGYLFRGPRPVIENIPESVDYGESIELRYRSEDAIDSVVLLRPGETTHSFTYNQIGVELEFEDSGESLSATIPSNPHLIPPGYYLLFVLTEKGVPNVARFTLVGAAS